MFSLSTLSNNTWQFGWAVYVKMRVRFSYLNTEIVQFTRYFHLFLTNLNNFHIKKKSMFDFFHRGGGVNPNPNNQSYCLEHA